MATEKIKPDFAGLLQRLRAERRVTQEELAELAGLSPRTVSDLERGISQKPQRYTAERLADGLGLTGPVRELFVAAARGRIPAADVLDADCQDKPAPAPSPPPARLSTPAQLPHSIPGFSAREAELGWLNSLLPADNRDAGGSVVVMAIAGMAGVGKTTLAVHWAHQIRDRFPDGQLYVNLRGFDPAGPAMDPADAIRGFLDSFGVPVDRIPVDLDAQAALYRTLLAGRQVLIVLDNARDSGQVRPLLPGTPSCLVVVTSRNKLLSLVAADGAHPVAINLLSAEQARRLLIRRLGRHRVEADEPAVADIIASCAGLPLALSVAGARAAADADLPLADLAKELTEASGALDALDCGDQYSDVRAVFSWSYRALSEPAARLFRLLGLHAGPDIGVTAAASLAGLPPEQARAHLSELVRAHLLAQRSRGRFAFHDLLRVYAGELAARHDSAPDRHAAIQRLLDHYLHTACHANELLHPGREDGIHAAPRDPLVTIGKLADHRQALWWFDDEYQVLLAALRQAASEGFDVHTWQLAWALASYFDRRGHWHDAVACQRAALDAAIKLGDLFAQARCHGCLAYAYIPAGRYDHAGTHLLRALELYTGLSDHTGQAHTHHGLSWLLDQQHDYRAALPHAHQAVELCQASGDRPGQARSLNMVGWFHVCLGDYSEGLTYCQQALELQEELGDRFGEADTLDSIASAYSHLGRYRDAIHHYEQAVHLYREMGNRYFEADTLARLGDTHLADGDTASARAVWRLSLAILDGLGHREAADVREKLDHANPAA